MNTLVAPKGSLVLCKKGHPVCDLGEDLHVGDIGWATKFINWRGQKPPLQGRLGSINCPKCQARIWPGADALTMDVIFRPRKGL